MQTLRSDPQCLPYGTDLFQCVAKPLHVKLNSVNAAGVLASAEHNTVEQGHIASSPCYCSQTAAGCSEACVICLL